MILDVLRFCSNVACYCLQSLEENLDVPCASSHAMMVYQHNEIVTPRLAFHLPCYGSVE
jgi:hypothetical protein